MTPIFFEGAFPFPEPDPIPLPPRPPRLDPIRWPIRYGPAKVKILIVIDSSGGYDTSASFGLGIMLRDAFNVGTPAGTPLPDEYPAYANFEFTLAHRATGAGTTFGWENFVFSDARLASFHEVWLFGISTAAPYLNGTELAALTSFMNAGGGVLAMGDHEDLGLGLCGNVPRVNTMRKWWFNSPLPAGQQKAPDSTDLTRNDTVQFVGGADPGFNGQQDDTPQPVYVNYRYGHHWWKPHRWMRYPHPVLCGPRGAIRVFPDHAHEGDCVVPSTLSPTDYPGGVAPEVIARGRNVAGRTKDGFTIVEPREFGLLGAYDGHLPAANVGRVLVDATWHHWFNVNLIGLDNPPHDDVYKDILAFFRNCAVWLAPKERQKRMRLTGQVLALFTVDMVETTLGIRELVPEKFYLLGVKARDALGRLAPQCQVNAWLLELLAPLAPRIRRRFEVRGELPEPEPWESFVLDRMAMTALGGAVAALAMVARKSDYREADPIIDHADDIAAKGIRVGLEQAGRELQAGAKQLGQVLERYSKDIGTTQPASMETAD